MNTTTVFFEEEASAREAIWSASETFVPSDARVTVTPASAASGSEGASAGGALRGEVAGAPATAARRGATRRGLGRGEAGKRES
jgi:hypothetical protein